MERAERVIFLCLMFAISLIVPLLGVKGLYAYLVSNYASAIAFGVLIALFNFGIYYFVFLSGRPQKPKINKKPGYKYCDFCTEEMGLLAVYCCYCGKTLPKSKDEPPDVHISAEADFAGSVGGRCSDKYHEAILKVVKDEKLLYPRCFCALCGKELKREG